MSELTGRLPIPAELPFDYVLRESEGDPKQLILLLHGYSQSGAAIMKRLGPVMPPDAAVLAPNAPFPFAERTEGDYRMAYSWYFYDFRTDEYAVDMSTSLQFLETGIERMGYSHLPLRIAGFSQGGYLAPFVGQKLGQTLQVIGICSTYLSDELGGSLDFRADNIVGAQDDVVEPDNSERCFREVVKRARGGEVYRLPVGHRIDGQVAAKAGELLRLPL